MITAERLVRDLEAVGLAPGQRLFVHSSLKSLGKVRGGADSVIDAIQHVIGPIGTLIMPTFTYSLKMWTKEPFDPAITASRVGLITEVFWKRDDVRRTNHPTHSCAVWGAHAHEIADLHDTQAVGKASPLGWLLDNGGFILQLGTDQATNTALHLCEEMAEVPYLDTAFTHGRSYETAHRRLPDESVEEVRLEPVPGSSGGFPRIDPVLEVSGIIREGKVGEARTFLTPIAALVGTVVPVLRKHPGLLLSRDAEDENGQARRQRLHRDRETWVRDLMDLYIEGFPVGMRLRWPEREAIETAATDLVERALGQCREKSVAWIEKHLTESGVSIEESPEDSFIFSMWEPDKRTVRLWLGALDRLATVLAEVDVPCALPLRGMDSHTLRDLALVHEGFHSLCPTGSDTLQVRLAEEIAARLFADAILALPFPSLLVDVWLMHWSGSAAAHSPSETESL